MLCVKAFTQAGKTQRVAQIKLEDFGWESVPKGEYYERNGALSPNLSIDHKDRVLVGFTVRENTGLATREHPGHSLHILRFTAEGEIDHSFILPTNNWYNNGFYLGPNDQILARANEAFQFLSENENDPDGAAWQPLVSFSRDCYVSQSFSRRALVLRVEPPVGGPERSTYTIVDASSSPPRVVRTCPKMALYGENITDKFAYWGSYDRDDDLMVRFPFCDVEHYEEFPMLGRRASGAVLNDETLLKRNYSSAGPVEAELVGLDGQVKFSIKMAKNDLIREITTDDRNDRFLLIVETWRGGSRFFDVSGKLVQRRVVVYSKTRQELASIRVSTAFYRGSAVSFSPNGALLAVLENGKLSVLRLDD